MYSILMTDGGRSVSVFLLFGLGAAVGLLGGFFGVGGGWIVTPALNIFGMPMPAAVGTGLAYITGMSWVSAWRHRRRGYIRVKLGVTIGCAMAAGVKAGEWIMTALVRRGQADSIVRMLYIFLLFSLGAYMLRKTLHARGRGQLSASHADSHSGAPLQRVSWRPRIALDHEEATVSFWPVAGLGVATGLLTGILGVGGGFVLMPMMIYLIGLSTVSAVGTSLLCLVLVSPFGVLVYAIAGNVHFTAAGVMIAGALAGAPIGVYASHQVAGQRLRFLYAIMIVIGGLSVLLKQLDHWFPSHWFALASEVIILAAAGGMATLILTVTLVKGKSAK
jgi:uncharacterized membrane protein YfcA